MIINKAICFFILLALLFSKSLMAQEYSGLRQPVSEKLVPKIVVDNFKQQYPDVLFKGWYTTHVTYWQSDYSSNWYYGWYSDRKIVVYNYEKPNYYEAEFIFLPGELSRALYNKYGYWHETRTKIKGLTKGIYDSLKTSEYNNWEISATMEKMESPTWPVEIYRFQVSKRHDSRILRMDAEGNIIQIKELYQ